MRQIAEGSEPDQVQVRLHEHEAIGAISKALSTSRCLFLFPKSQVDNGEVARRDVLLFRIQLSLSQQISRFFLITISRPGVGKLASIGTRAQYPVPAKLVRRKSHSYSAGRRIPVASNPAFETGAIPPVTSFDRKAKIWSVVGVSSGNFLEMYDSMVFGYYTKDIGNTLFPGRTALVRSCCP